MTVARRWVERHDLLAFVLVAAITGVAVFGDHVMDGTFHNDSWSHYTYSVTASSFASEIDRYSWMAFRPLGMLYWPMTFRFLGTSAPAHLAWTVAAAVLMVTGLFAVLRQIEIPRLHAAAVGLVALVLPAADSTRIWAGASNSSVAIALWLFGLALTLTAFKASDRKAVWLQALGVAMYVASLLLYEIAAVAMIASAWLYFLVAPRRAALARAALDTAMALAMLVWVRGHSIYEADDPGAIADRVRPFFGQAARVFAQSAAPVVNVPTLAVVVGTSTLLASAVLVLRRAGSSVSEEPARHWLVMIAFGAAVMAAGWGVFLPSSQFWPLAMGQFNRVNALAGIGVVVSLYGVVVLVGMAIGSLGGRTALGGALAGGAAFVFLAFGYIGDVRADLRTWERADRAQDRALDAVRASLPPPRGRTVVFMFGQPVQAAPGVPILQAPWDVEGGLLDRFPGTAITGYPMLQGTQLDCGEQQVIAHNGNDVFARQIGPYRETWFVDTSRRVAKEIRTQRACEQASTRFRPGPEYLPGG